MIFPVRELWAIHPLESISTEQFNSFVNWVIENILWDKLGIKRQLGYFMLSNTWIWPEPFIQTWSPLVVWICIFLDIPLFSKSVGSKVILLVAPQSKIHLLLLSLQHNTPNDIIIFSLAFNWETDKVELFNWGFGERRIKEAFEEWSSFSRLSLSSTNPFSNPKKLGLGFLWCFKPGASSLVVVAVAMVAASAPPLLS